MNCPGVTCLGTFPNMDKLVSVLQDELHAGRKELKESASAVDDKAV